MDRTTEEQPAQPTPSGFLKRCIARWRRTNEWFRSFVAAVLVLLVVHTWFLSWVTVRSDSMYATLLPGDLVAMTKWCRWTGFSRGDVAVFRDPLQDDRSMLRRPLLVKRIAAMPGDELRLKDGRLWINGAPVGSLPTQTSSWIIRVKSTADKAVLLKDAGLPSLRYEPVGNTFELPLNEELAQRLRADKRVLSAEPAGSARGASGHLFPFSPVFRWNVDDYGPITVPKKGATVKITVDNLPLFDRIITHYEGHKLEVSGATILMDGKPLKEYTFSKDHYFMLGDSRHYSADSRYWGFVPEDHLLGRAAFVLLSKAEHGLRSDRWFQPLP